MISVRLLGHIRSSVGKESVELSGDTMSAVELVDRIRSLAASVEPGFSAYNTIVMVEDGEAFVPASQNRELHSGDRIVLLPFSHGG